MTGDEKPYCRPLWDQIGALISLAQLDPGWGVAASVAFVMAVQGVSGVAKDLAKMSSKSAVKLLAPQEDGGLFRLVNVRTALDQAELTLDKARFEEWLVAQGLPTTRTFAGSRDGR